jgi:hypothetical protein
MEAPARTMQRQPEPQSHLLGHEQQAANEVRRGNALSALHDAHAPCRTRTRGTQVSGTRLSAASGRQLTPRIANPPHKRASDVDAARSQNSTNAIKQPKPGRKLTGLLDLGVRVLARARRRRIVAVHAKIAVERVLTDKKSSWVQRRSNAAAKRSWLDTGLSTRQTTERKRRRHSHQRDTNSHPRYRRWEGQPASQKRVDSPTARATGHRECPSRPHPPTCTTAPSPACEKRRQGSECVSQEMRRTSGLRPGQTRISCVSWNPSDTTQPTSVAQPRLTEESPKDKNRTAHRSSLFMTGGPLCLRISSSV